MNVGMMLGQSFPKCVSETPDLQYAKRTNVTKGFCEQMCLGKAEQLN